MSKPTKSLLIVTPICFALAGLTVLLCVLDPEFDAGNARITAFTVIFTVWAFFIAPASIIAIVCAKSFFERLDFARAFRIGYLLGGGFGVLIGIFLLLVSPVSGTIWFIKTVKSLMDIKKDGKSNRENDRDKSDEVFEI